MSAKCGASLPAQTAFNVLKVRLQLYSIITMYNTCNYYH